MADKRMTAEAVITAKDATGAVFANVAAKIRGISKAAQSFKGLPQNLGRDIDRSVRQLRGIGAMARVGGAMSDLASTAMMFSGPAALGYGAKKIVEQGAKAQHERIRMEAAGMAADEIQHANDEAVKLSAKVPNFDQSTVMHMLRNARSIVGSYEEAAEIIEPLLKMRAMAQAAHPGVDFGEDFDKLVKGLEIKGVTQHLDEFRSYMEGMAKAINVFGDTLKPSDYYEMFKYGRQATRSLSEEFMLSVGPTIAQELGGASAGNALATFYQTVVGGKMKNVAVKEAAKLGLVDMSKVVTTKVGDIKGIQPGGIIGADLAAANPYKWVNDVFLPAMEKHGITSPERMQEIIAAIFRDRVAAQLVSILATQQKRIDKDSAQVKGAKGLEAAEIYNTKDFQTAWNNLKTQLTNAAEELGRPLSEGLTPAINDVVKALGHWSKNLHDANEKSRKGEDTDGQKKANRALNRLLGIDSDRAPDSLSPEERRAARMQFLQNDVDQDARDRLELKGVQDEIERRKDQGIGEAIANGGIGLIRRRNALRDRVSARDAARRELAELQAQRAAAEQARERATKEAEEVAWERGMKDYELSKAPLPPSRPGKQRPTDPYVTKEWPTGPDEQWPPKFDAESIKSALSGLKAEVKQPVPVDVTGKVQLEGKADVSVKVSVQGPGQVTGMSTSSSGHVAAKVGANSVGE